MDKVRERLAAKKRALDESKAGGAVKYDLHSRVSALEEEEAARKVRPAPMRGRGFGCVSPAAIGGSRGTQRQKRDEKKAKKAEASAADADADAAGADAAMAALMGFGSFGSSKK